MVSISNEQSLVYSVAELNQTVAIVLSESFPTVKVVGEISNFSAPRSGHWYFSLKDNKAQVRCVFFQGKQRAGPIELKDGIQIIVSARLRLYEVRGEFQLIVEAIERVGDGVLQQRFEALKQRLAEEGLFDSTRKRALPHLINTVGLITSPTGAAIRDILAVLNRRFPAIQIIIYPSLVQGAEAADQIIRQLALANERAECQVLLLTRGGGSLEDLWPFNEEKVARAIVASELPTVSAVGHEIDTTIADFAADIRAPTPSAAAELISPDQLAWKHRLMQLEENLQRIIKNQLGSYQQRLSMLERCLRHPEQRLQNISQHLDECERKLYQATEQQLSLKQQKLLSLTQALETLNPLATLKRGYALAMRSSDNSVLQSNDMVGLGDDITVQLAHGKLLCYVKQRVELDTNH